VSFILRRLSLCFIAKNQTSRSFPRCYKDWRNEEEGGPLKAMGVLAALPDARVVGGKRRDRKRRNRISSSSQALNSLILSHWLFAELFEGDFEIIHDFLGREHRDRKAAWFGGFVAAESIAECLWLVFESEPKSKENIKSGRIQPESTILQFESFFCPLRGSFQLAMDF
jgi:hypothetical protein